MRVLVIVMSVLMSTPAAAEATSQEFLVQHKGASDDGKTYLEGFLQGILAGYRASNMTLKAKGQSPLFCLTTQARSELEDPVRVLKNAIGTDPSLKSSPVSIAFLVNLTRRFPCRAVKETETTK
mgnify:CR=1 FL=1|tara:strand:- start:93 stop:464 length:372 start_codon:yes stop_codon:yes gene_type:complete